jgi:hypothetical protein
MELDRALADPGQGTASPSALHSPRLGFARMIERAAAAAGLELNAFTDAVQYGLVDNLSRPGSNVTGVNTMQAELGAKRLELLHMLLPRAKRVGLLVNPTLPAVEQDITIAQSAAKGMGLSLELLNAATGEEIDKAFARAVELGRSTHWRSVAAKISATAGFNSLHWLRGKRCRRSTSSAASSKQVA